MVRTRLIRTDVISIAMIHATRPPVDRSPRFESAGAEAEAKGVVVEVGMVVKVLVIKVLEASLV